MGFMNKLNKMKSFFFDEEEVVEEKKPVKKEKVRNKVEERKEQEDFSKTQEIEELYFEDISETKKEVETPVVKSRTIKNESEFKFPEFNDEDFMVSRVKPEPIMPVVREEPKPVLYQGSKRKEETKKFKPSPIISPIYGLLDNEGNTVKKDEKVKKSVSKDKDDISFDEVRKKAYGNIDEEIENTLKRLSKKTIEEAERDMEREEKELSRTKEKNKHNNTSQKVIMPSVNVLDNEDDDDDDMILPNVNFREIDVDKERSKNRSKNKTREISSNQLDDDDDTKEQDLFNLIDTMYSGEEKEK